jgi:2-polyprenyl-6-hydroxyphenyl methylase / 3-demethylubiquinone-9 3-methyltransferase
MGGAAPAQDTGTAVAVVPDRVAPMRPRNDPQQYVDLRDEWWSPRGGFAMLHWIAAARARLVPRATHDASVLVDLGCGGGVLAPHLADHGHRVIGVDLIAASAALAREHGTTPVVADLRHLPLANECADVVVAGEVLEHVTDLPGVLGEAIRVLRPGGTLVIDTIADTWWGRFSTIAIGERIPAGPPKRLHDGDLFVDRAELVDVCARHGVALTLTGMRMSARDYLAWLMRRRDDVRMVSTRSTAGLFQAVGRKEST